MKRNINGYTFTIKLFLNKRLRVHDGKYPVYIMLTYMRNNNQFPLCNILGESLYMDDSEKIDPDTLLIKGGNLSFNELFIKCVLIELLNIAARVTKNDRGDVTKIVKSYLSKRKKVESLANTLLLSYRRRVLISYYKKMGFDKTLLTDALT